MLSGQFFVLTHFKPLGAKRLLCQDQFVLEAGRGAY